MQIKRRKARVVKIGSVKIGGSNPVAIQSMTKTATADIEATVRQINNLQQAGCQIIRVAVKDQRDADAISKIRSRIKIPLVADIHFDWRLAVSAIENGADKIRLNPGNIFRKAEVAEIAAAAKMAGIPIRVGVNSGSLKNPKSQIPNPKLKIQSMVKSALSYVKMLERFKFRDIVVSLKANNILDTVEAYRKMAALCDYPLHLGVTATGSPFAGAIKSSIAIGTLLSEGIGDTIRVSLTAEPLEEVKAARFILESLGLEDFGPQLISCPTCGRCEVNLPKIVRELESRLTTNNYKLTTRQPKVAVMGCVVNGPGEAREADLGVAFGKKGGLLFKKGRPVRKVGAAECVKVLFKELKSFDI